MITQSPPICSFVGVNDFTGKRFAYLTDRLTSLLVELALASVDSDETVVETPEGNQYKGPVPFHADNSVAIVSKDDAL